MEVAQDSQVSLPCFDTTSKAERERSDYERLVMDYGYPWTTTKTLAQGEILEDQKQDGKALILPVENQVKVENVKRAWATRKTRVTYGPMQSVRVGSQGQGVKRQQVVNRNGTYNIVATEEGGATFIEALVCLGPSAAIRLLQAKEIRWLDENGSRVSKAQIIPILQTATAVKTVKTVRDGKMKYVYRVRFPGDGEEPLAAALQQWFDKEWDEYDKRRGRAGIIPTQTIARLRRAHAVGKKPKAGAAENEDAMDEDDSDSDDYLDSDYESDSDDESEPSPGSDADLAKAEQPEAEGSRAASEAS